ncbi:MAG: hypothetical protein FJW38_07240 [Acidobacteria bacterium]|nr:hypothetical protein [Acidobacteriota bacterium]
MLADFRIEGYRCFRDLKLENLRRINLIAGKNSVGKSAVLEAVSIYEKRSLAGIREMLAARGDYSVEMHYWTSELVAPMFYGSDPDTRFAEYALSSSQRLRVNLGAQVQRQPGRWEIVGETALNRGAYIGPELPVLNFRIDDDDDSLRFIVLDGSVPLPANSKTLARGRKCIYVRTAPRNMDTLCRYLEKIAGTPLEDEVIRILRWVQPDIDRVRTRSVGQTRVIVYDRRGGATSQPLKRLGDGAVKLMSFALSIANCEDGVCLVDEIENGIHHELFDQLWEAIARFAEELNVQVFATTHSKDCIEAFERSYRNPKFDAAFYRLERNGADIGAVRLDHESFFAVVEGTPYEVR